MASWRSSVNDEKAVLSITSVWLIVRRLVSIVDYCPSTFFLSHNKWRERVYWDRSWIRKQIRGLHWVETLLLPGPHHCHRWRTGGAWWIIIPRQVGESTVDPNREVFEYPPTGSNTWFPTTSPMYTVHSGTAHNVIFRSWIEASGFIHGTNMTAITEYQKIQKKYWNKTQAPTQYHIGSPNLPTTSPKWAAPPGLLPLSQGATP